MKRIVRGALSALLVFSCAAGPVLAAGEASDVVVEVTDASSGAPVSLARVLLVGETGAIGYTDAQGHARFESVATGTYRAEVRRRDYTAARSALFDVVANRATTLHVRLARSGGLQKIGGVTVTTSPAHASREVGQDDALRHLDGSLRDALGDLPGLTSSGGGVGIDGNDPSQTGTSVDGVPIPGAGSDFGDRGINADLAAAASASSGASHGSLGGNVAFRTLQPTRFPQAQATLQYGGNDASSAQIAARGSLGNLGFVAQHASRGVTSPLTGMTFADASGLTYRHDGDTYATGDLAKLRWSPSLAQTLTATASATSESDAFACALQTANLPCGSGPGVGAARRGAFATLAETATIGSTSLFVAGFTATSRNDQDASRAYVAGAPAPSSASLRSLARGVTLNVQLPAGERHELSVAATSYGLRLDGAQSNALGAFTLADALTYRAATLSDRIRPNDRLTLTARGGINGSSGNAGVTGGIGVRWQPVHDLAYDLTASGGDAGAAIAVNNAGLPDPRSLTFSCADGEAVGSVPAVNAARQRSSSLRASVERSGKRARVALTAWTQRLTAAPVLAAFDPVGLPPSYLQAVDQLAASPYICGGAAPPSLTFTGFVPADQIARGATLAGTWQIGQALLAGYASVQSRFVTGGSAQTAALTPPGVQVPDTPLHRAGLVATQRLGRSVDLLANVSYTAANNPNRLPAYTLLNAGIAAPLKYGSLALVGRNLTNRFAGPILPRGDVAPLARSGGAALVLPAQPLAARSVALTYTVRAGRVGAAGSGAGTATPSAEEEGDGGGVRLAIRGRRIGAIPPADALTIDPDNEECTPVAARIAQPVLSTIASLRDAAERAKTAGGYPASLRGAPATLGGIVLRYVAYDGGARYAIVVEGAARRRAAVINCVQLGVARPDDVTSFHLYAETPRESPEGPPLFIAYAPAAGLYLVPSATPGHGMVTVNAAADPEPASPPADPFAPRAGCPASSKPLADATVAAVRAALAGNVPPADVVTVTPHGTPPAWLSIAVNGPPFPLLQCLHVAAVPAEHLRAAGISDDRRSGVGFARRFGFYTVASAGGPSGSP